MDAQQLATLMMGQLEQPGESTDTAAKAFASAMPSENVESTTIPAAEPISQTIQVKEPAAKKNAAEVVSKVVADIKKEE